MMLLVLILNFLEDEVVVVLNVFAMPGIPTTPAISVMVKLTFSRPPYLDWSGRCIVLSTGMLILDSFVVFGSFFNGFCVRIVRVP